MGRPVRIHQSEHPYHVTTRTVEGAYLIGLQKLDRDSIIAIIKILGVALKSYNVVLRHFTLMGNHYHLLILTPDANISDFMQYFNSRVAEHVNRQLKDQLGKQREGHVWAKRYHATIVDSDTYVENVTRYIYDNPVRAGMVNDPTDNEFCSISFYVNGVWAYAEIKPDDVFLSLGQTDEECREQFFHKILRRPLDKEGLADVRKGVLTPSRRAYGSMEFELGIYRKHDPDHVPRYLQQAVKAMEAAAGEEATQE